MQTFTHPIFLSKLSCAVLKSSAHSADWRTALTHGQTDGSPRIDMFKKGKECHCGFQIVLSDLYLFGDSACAPMLIAQHRQLKTRSWNRHKVCLTFSLGKRKN